MNAQRLLFRTVRNSPRWFGAQTTALVVAVLMALPLASTAGVYLSVNIAPPELPVYEQPPIPADGYIWTPGYWAYSDDGYFWVPGTWVLAPYRGALWTPGYWGWRDNGGYAFHSGYWGDHVGFYGGVDYGYGYGGEGYQGGYWNGDRLYYNRSVNNINVTNVNVYNKTVINNTTINRVSYQGGQGGVAARPTSNDLLAARERHTQPVTSQQQQIAMASHDRALLASVNHGAPVIAATQRPGHFSGPGVVRARPAGPQERSAGAKDVQARPAGSPAQPVLGVNRRDVAHDAPNALRSARFAPHAHNVGADRPSAPGQADRTGAGAIARHTGQVDAHSAHSTNFAPQTHDARSMHLPSRDAGARNSRDGSRDMPNAARSASFAPRVHDTRLLPPQPGSDTRNIRDRGAYSDSAHFSSATHREMAPSRRSAYTPGYPDNRRAPPPHRDRSPESGQSPRPPAPYPSPSGQMPMRVAPYRAQGRPPPDQHARPHESHAPGHRNDPRDHTQR